MQSRISGLAVVIAAVVHFGLGTAWFTLFAKPWMAGLGMTPEQLQAARQNITPLPYFAALICSLVMACAIAWILSTTANPGVLKGLLTGIAVGIIVAAAMLTEYGFERRPYMFALIAAGYPFVGSMLMGTIIGAFRRRDKAEGLKAAA